MKQSILAATAGAILLVTISACGGGDDGDSVDPTATTAPVATATVAPVATSPPVDAGSDPDVIAAGQTKYGACSACHGLDGRGVPGLGKDLVENPFMDSLTDAELLEFIKVGRGPDDPDNTTGIAMPPKGGNPSLDDDDILAIIAYINTLE